MLMAMKPKTSARRQPAQRRARQTVDAILDAVIRVLKREGVHGVTTNRIAEVAGVSIGSVYQYFPDKHAIFTALHQRHIEEIDRMIASRLLEHSQSSLDTLMRALAGGTIGPLPSAANDAAAASAGVKVGGLYQSGGAVKIRLA